MVWKSGQKWENMFSRSVYRTFVWLALIVPVLSRDEIMLSDLGRILYDTDFASELLALNEYYPNDTCISDVTKYIQGIFNGSQGAIQMFDSMEKIPFGLLFGHNTYIGNFDECISAKTEDFKGKHCMLDFDLDEPQNQNPLMENFKLSYGICLPSTCNESDIENALNLLNIASVLNITVDEGNCLTNDPTELSPNSWIAIGILICVGLMVVFSTAYELMFQRNPAKRHELFTSFSLCKNWKQLMSIYKGPGNIGCLHGIRTLTMCWVVLAHEYAMAVMNPTLNRAVLFEYLMKKDTILITNGFVSVDTFFLMSGLLVTLIFFRDISKKGSYDVPVAMIHRFLRITPAYAAMVLIQSCLIYELGSGPMWNKTVKAGVDVCKEYWWSGLLYIQNFVSPMSTCLGQSWYLTSDMQMFWLSPLLLYPLMLSPTIALLIYVLCLAAALTTDIIIAIVYDLGPQVFLTNSRDQFIVEYVQTHTRLVPYIIGMGLAYVICGIKAKKIRVNLSKVWIITGWLAATALCLGSIYGISYFLDYGTENKIEKNVSYLVLHRLGWSLGLSWIIFACFAGYGGIIDKFLSWDGFQVLGKLSYCMFLVHFTVQICKVGMRRTNFYISDFENVTRFFSTLVLSVFMSIPLHMMFEVPFCNLDKYALRNVSIFPYPRRKPGNHVKNTGNTAAEEGIENKGYQEEQK